MNTYEKALEEFNILEKMKYETEEDIPIVLQYKEEILALIKKFGASGQSGGSAPCTASIISSALKSLCLHEAISPITGEEDEWMAVSEYMEGKFLYQNTRCSALFKEGKEGKPYYPNAIVFKGEDPWDTFTGKVEDVTSYQTIKGFPFIPKTFYIDVTRERTTLPHDSELARVVDCGDGNFIYHIKDSSQLDEVFSYYEKE